MVIWEVALGGYMGGYLGGYWVAMGVSRGVVAASATQGHLNLKPTAARR